MTSLLLVRHGVTEENLRHVLIGRTDPPLHPLGVLQARAAARELAPTPLRRIVSSPLARAVATADWIARLHPGTPRAQDARLAEIDLGIVDGMSSFAAFDRYPELFARALDEDAADFGFPQGETRTAALARFSAALRDITGQDPQGAVCVVTHGGAVGLWIARHKGLALGRLRACQPAHGAIVRARWSRADGYTIDRENDVGHLSAALRARIEQARHQIP